MSLVIQSVLIPKDKYTLIQSRKWIADNHFKLSFYGKQVDITDKYYRYRQMAPSRFVKDKYITIDFKDGVKLIKGELKK
jgi:hypothetical protein